MENTDKLGAMILLVVFLSYPNAMLANRMLMSGPRPYELKVPLVAQPAWGYCGVASFQMVYNYYGLNVTQRQLWSMYQKDVGGFNTTYFGDLIHDAQTRGFIAYEATVNLNNPSDVLGVLSEFGRLGVPLIVWQYVETGNYSWHTRVVVGLGYNLSISSYVVYVNDPLFNTTRQWRLTDFTTVWNISQASVGYYVVVEPIRIAFRWLALGFPFTLAEISLLVCFVIFLTRSRARGRHFSAEKE